MFLSTCPRTAVAEPIGSHLSPCLPYRSISPTSQTPEVGCISHLNDLHPAACDTCNCLGFLFYFISWLNRFSALFRLDGLAPIRLAPYVTVYSPMGRYRWLVRPFRAGLPCWVDRSLPMASLTLMSFAKGNTHVLIYYIYSARCVDSSHYRSKIFARR